MFHGAATCITISRLIAPQSRLIDQWMCERLISLYGDGALLGPAQIDRSVSVTSKWEKKDDERGEMSKVSYAGSF